MSAFEYAAPTRLGPALDLLSSCAESGRRTQILAGGTDVIVQMRTSDREPRLLLDVKRLPETRQLSIGSEDIFVGAAIPSAELNENPRLASLLPGLMESADLIGSTQIQGRASIGGNLCNASPAGDTIPALIANSAQCEIAGARGTRQVAAADFVVGVGKSCLKRDELLLGFRVKRPRKGFGDAYLRFIPRTEMDIAVAGVAVSMELDEAGVCKDSRIAIGAVAERCLLVRRAGERLIGTSVEDSDLGRAGAECSASARPISDKRGTAEYRRKIIAVLCRRAGRIAHGRALASLKGFEI